MAESQDSHVLTAVLQIKEQGLAGDLYITLSFGGLLAESSVAQKKLYNSSYPFMYGWPFKNRRLSRICRRILVKEIVQAVLSLMESGVLVDKLIVRNGMVRHDKAAKTMSVKPGSAVPDRVFDEVSRLIIKHLKQQIVDDVVGETELSLIMKQTFPVTETIFPD